MKRKIKLAILVPAVMASLGALAELCYTTVLSVDRNTACLSSPCQEQLYSPSLQLCDQLSSRTGYSGCETNGTYQMTAIVFGGGTCVNFVCQNANTYVGTVTNSRPNLVLIPCGT